jgi:thioredoxin reductase
MVSLAAGPVEPRVPWPWRGTPPVNHDASLPTSPTLLCLETSKPGVFVAGDVRKGSIKRLASAVGEGAMAVQFVHYSRRERVT